jgi:GT2 family glycosyltransferase
MARVSGAIMIAVTSVPAVDVVVLTWNDGQLLDAAVASALASTDVHVNVFVIDNGSDPPAPPLYDTRVRQLRNPTNRGVAAARNQGVQATDAPYVCFLDSDACLRKTCLSRLLAPIAAGDDIGLAAPVFTDQAAEASAGRAPSALRKLGRVLNILDTYAPVESAGSRPWWDVEFAIGACQVFRRDAFDSVAGLDEGYFYGPEDVDFCLRLRRAGWRVVQVRDAQCDHPARRRHRGIWTIRGARHAAAVLRHLWRHSDVRRSRR